MSHVAKERKKLLARVNRILGQVKALHSAIERAETDADCHRVMQQVASIRGAMNGLLLQFLDEHTREHIARGKTQADRDRAAEELIEALRSFRA
ncbi:MAG: metal/formaldehyde-sensitive transcriptional repressor [Candidatus Hydrogenedentes bacterium]|nr:metal/formaldehyde-sensitive transcriptional repressor [Candidatus Hydrogenedentota bacterium]